MNGKPSKILERTLITGSNGAVGSYVDFGIKTNFNSLDITKWDVVSRVIRRHKPSVIIHLAAETDLDKCEHDPDHAYMVNSVGTYHVAMAAKSVGAKMVYVSTAGVFNGEKKGLYSEKDNPDPRNVYGHSKYLGEVIVQKLLDDYIIARVCWMFGGGPTRDKKFIAKIIEQLDKPVIRAIDNSFGSPTFSKDLINAVKVLILNNKRGIFHLNNKGRASRYDFAKEIVRALNKQVDVVPVNSSYFNLPAKRIANEAMSSKLNLMRPWQEALREYLSTEWMTHEKINS